jgi:hypothetical protein
LDIDLLKYAQLFIRNVNTYITIYDKNGILRKNSTAQEALEELNDNSPKHIAILRDKKLDLDWLDSQDLMLISLDGWKSALSNDAHWIDLGMPTLVIRP